MDYFLRFEDVHFFLLCSRLVIFLASYWKALGMARIATFEESIFKLAVIEKVKAKAVPLQAWSGPEGSRKLRFPDFMTTQAGGKVVSLTHRPPLPPGNTPATNFC
jgi:hypothetical protein